MFVTFCVWEVRLRRKRATFYYRDLRLLTLYQVRKLAR